jgi:uncharacterized protein DUF2855
MSATFVVDRKELRRTQWLDRAATILPTDHVRVRIDRFALTSNNITYAAFGEAMHYWDFFPTGDDRTGCVPVWGFATVSESRHEGVATGRRLYGFFPMADEVDLEPAAASAHGFDDGAAHRRALPGIYNRYLLCDDDPALRREDEPWVALLRPLFTTSFLIDDFLADNAFFGARSVVISSASSKTAYGLAFCLADRGGPLARPRTVGLTSPRNLAFTRQLGCYDDAIAYDDVATAPVDEPVVYVDMSGDVGVRDAVHRRWNERLAYSCSVGATHWQELGSAKGLAGPKPVLFFAPSQAQRRIGEWGAKAFHARLAAAWTAFVARVADPGRPWLRVSSGQGREAVSTTYLSLLDGQVPADVGWVLRV